MAAAAGWDANGRQAGGQAGGHVCSPAALEHLLKLTQTVNHSCRKGGEGERQAEAVHSVRNQLTRGRPAALGWVGG